MLFSQCEAQNSEYGRWPRNAGQASVKDKFQTATSTLVIVKRKQLLSFLLFSIPESSRVHVQSGFPRHMV